MYAAAPLVRDLSIAYLRANLGVQRRIDNTRGRVELGLSYAPIEQTVLDTARSLVGAGLV
jgi:hypothetical protein